MAFHDEVEIEDFEFDEETNVYTYPCPCGDRFTISKVWQLRYSFSFSSVLCRIFSYSCLFQEELENGENVAKCPSCSLIVKVIYNLVRTKQQTTSTQSIFDYINILY